ncbi:hypothetical protein O181_006200 [Austropuccinia psidii MF-1]|uniref:Uncharacterized protein n=1 Tax=Austropuccinia psidii MF-1 TaxID=1389203 RepID=A0A9Q3BKI4_9BASI|nr:hypothetical protein [Austropuccinia psidii MF-1]
MDQDQDIKVINQKYKNASPEERHKWRIPELSQFPKILYSSEEVHGPRKDRGPSEGLETHVLQRKSQKDEGLVAKPKHFVGGPEERAGPKKGKQVIGSSLSLYKQESASTSAKQGTKSPKEQLEGQEKGKVQVEQTLHTEIQNSKERKDSHRQCVQYGKSSDGIKKQVGGKN